MLKFAAYNWVDYLLSASPSDVPLDHKKEIAKMLLATFRSGESMSRWVKVCGWRPTNGTIQAVQQWWKDEEVLQSLSIEERDFISSTEDDPLAAMEPLLTFCARKWLCDDDWNAGVLAATICSYQRLVAGKPYDTPLSIPTVDEIIEASEFANFEKNGLWYRRCAEGLRSIWHATEALNYLAKASKLEPGDFRIKLDMAQTYDLQGNWQKAIELGEETAQILSEKNTATPADDSLKSALHSTQELLGMCYWQLGDMEKRFEAFKKAYENTAYCKCIGVFLEHYGSNNSHEATIELLKKLADTPVPQQNHSQLTQALWDNPDADEDFFIVVADAALATNKLEFMAESWRSAAREARKVSKTVTAAQLDIGLARIYSEFLHDQGIALTMWGTILDTYASAGSKSKIAFTKGQASYKLARELLCNAVGAGFGTPEAEAAGAKLVNLVEPVKIDGGLPFIKSHPAIIALGVYYRLNGQEANSRALFRPFVQRAIQILSDDDPYNDFSGYNSLFYTLAAAGDIKNVIAICYKEGDYRAEGAISGNGGFGFICDGPCRRSFRNYDKLSLCSICYDTGFCEDCVKLLEEGKMVIKTCDSKHVKDFIYIPPRPKEIDEGQMLVNGEAIDFEAWKDQLRKEWGLWSM
jgi:tetratricopeptide (TPR) repeat protein